MPDHHPPAPPVDDPGAGLLAALPFAALTTDLAGCVVAANQVALALFAVSMHEVRGQPAVTALFPPAEQGAADEVMRKVLRGERWQGELQVRAQEEMPRAMNVSAAALLDGGQVTGTLLVAEDVGSTRRRMRVLPELDPVGEGHRRTAVRRRRRSGLRHRHRAYGRRSRRHGGSVWSDPRRPARYQHTLADLRPHR